MTSDVDSKNDASEPSRRLRRAPDQGTYASLLKHFRGFERRARLLELWIRLEDSILVLTLVAIALGIVGILTGWSVSAWLLIGLGLLGLAWCAEPLVRASRPSESSASMDRRGRLKDEMKSAYWLGDSQRKSDPLVVSLVDRAASRAARLDISQLLPLRTRWSRFAALPLLLLLWIVSPAARESLSPMLPLVAQTQQLNEPSPEAPASARLQAALAENPELAELRRLLMEGTLSEEQLAALSESLESLGLEMEDLEATPEESDSNSPPGAGEAEANAGEPDPSAETDADAPPSDGAEDGEQAGEAGEEGESSPSSESESGEGQQSEDTSETQPSDQAGAEGQTSEGSAEEQSGESEEDPEGAPSSGGGEEVSAEGSEGAEEAGEDENKGSSGHSSGPSDVPVPEPTQALPLEVQLELELMGQENTPPEMAVGRSNNVPSLAATGSQTQSAGAPRAQGKAESAVRKQLYPSRLQNSIRRYFLQLSRKETGTPR